jgi:hypothetical protein
MSQKDIDAMTDEERIQKAIESLEQVQAQLEEIPSLMFSDGGDLYPDQGAMVSILRMLSESTVESFKNRFDGEDDSPRVEYTTKLLWEIHEDPTFRELNSPEA